MVEGPLAEAVDSDRVSWDNRYRIDSLRLLPGEYYVTGKPELITTLLGSCISACIRHPGTGVGGMNHFMLPEPGDLDQKNNWGGVAGRATRYGSAAMEHLINDVLKAGGDRNDLEVKVFGGGYVLSRMTDIGRRNIEFVKGYMAREGMTIVASDVGDKYAREVHYYPATGLVRVRQLQNRNRDIVAAREQTYEHDLERDTLTGKIELFNGS